jgi:hypothetical protein
MKEAPPPSRPLGPHLKELRLSSCSLEAQDIHQLVAVLKEVRAVAGFNRRVCSLLILTCHPQQLHHGKYSYYLSIMPNISGACNKGGVCVCLFTNRSLRVVCRSWG